MNQSVCFLLLLHAIEGAINFGTPYALVSTEEGTSRVQIDFDVDAPSNPIKQTNKQTNKEGTSRKYTWDLLVFFYNHEH